MTSVSDALTTLILETFRLNGRLLAAGDALVRGLNLTSARWQVLGAIAGAPSPISVAQAARSMGLTRQAVQRLANELEREGLVSFADNPNHRRAKLILMTPRGQSAYELAMERQLPWAGALAQGLAAERIEAAAATLKQLRQRLEGDVSDRKE